MAATVEADLADHLKTLVNGRRRFVLLGGCRQSNRHLSDLNRRIRAASVPDTAISFGSIPWKHTHAGRVRDVTYLVVERRYVGVTQMARMIRPLSTRTARDIERGRDLIAVAENPAPLAKLFTLIAGGHDRPTSGEEDEPLEIQTSRKAKMTATILKPVAELLNATPTRPTTLPTTPTVVSDPISAARHGGHFGRQAVRDHLARVEVEHAKKRPPLVRTAESARRAADRAKAEADHLAAVARDAELALFDADSILAHVRIRAAVAFRLNAPARLVETGNALRKHQAELLESGDSATAQARSRRAMAIAEVFPALDSLAVCGLDGEELEAEIRGLIARIDAAS